MMEPFPEEWELLSLFETEPQILDPGIPWAYNNLKFETTRGSDRILCVIEPGYERLDFTWWHNQTKHLALELHWVSGLTVVTGGGNDYLVAPFRDQHLSELRLQLKEMRRAPSPFLRSVPVLAFTPASVSPRRLPS